MDGEIDSMTEVILSKRSANLLPTYSQHKKQKLRVCNGFGA